MDESPLENELQFIHKELLSYINSLHQREALIEQKEKELSEREARLARREQEIEDLNRMCEH